MYGPILGDNYLWNKRISQILDIFLAILFNLGQPQVNPEFFFLITIKRLFKIGSDMGAA